MPSSLREKLDELARFAARRLERLG
jgi:hypothetical protein